MTTSQNYALALQHQLTGHLANAEALYRQVLAADPNHTEALHHLGMIAHQVGRHTLAAELISKSLSLRPDVIEARNDLGNVLQDLGRFDEAAAAYRHCIDLDPNLAEAHNNLGSALAAQKDYEQAETAYRSAIVLQPNLAAAYNGLGAALTAHGRVPEALQALQRALELRPDYPQAYNNLGAALRSIDQIAESVTAYRQAILLKPDYSEAHYNLGNALRQANQLDEAAAAYRQALQWRPAYPEAHNNLGNALKDQGQLDEAIASYRLAFQDNPAFLEARSNLIYTLQFHPPPQPALIEDEQAQWNRQAEMQTPAGKPVPRRDRSSRRRLRIGYVSPEFRNHVIGRNIAPLFHAHNRQDFEIICYSGVQREDALTDFFRRHADLWRDTVRLSNDAFFRLLQEDDVDILVDLTQHLSGNRLPVFARHPAPVQISFAGYPASTGLDAIGYRISDRYLESNPTPSPAEQVYFLDSFWCYTPSDFDVEIRESRSLKNGTLTFGCLNNFCKLNEPFLQLCARTLRSITDSRIVFLATPGSHREWVRKVLRKEGIEEQRVEFVEPRPHREYLELYHQLDVVLDPFPYNGHTTSLDALWMGVPIVSLAAATPVSRGGLSILNNLGLPELATYSEDDFVKTAVRLANDPPRLSGLRRTLRSRMQASSLTDQSRFTLGVENAYRTAWQHWCAKI